MPALSRTVGLRVAAARDRRGMTQDELARRARVHRLTIVNIERGTELPTLRTLERIAEALRVPIADLLR